MAPEYILHGKTPNGCLRKMGKKLVNKFFAMLVGEALELFVGYEGSTGKIF